MTTPQDDLVFDVETVPTAEWDELDGATRAYLAQRSRSQLIRDGHDSDGADLLAQPRAADRLALELGMAKVVAIGMCNVRTGEAAVLLEHSGDARAAEMERPRIYVQSSEEALLRRWWQWLGSGRRVVSFNGRGYDGPVLMIRSAQLGIPCTRQLVPYRYDLSEHCDMADVLKFQGSLSGGYGVDWWCRRFGIESPKQDGVDGGSVTQLYREGRMMEIAAYVARDVRAERDLYLRLRSSFLHLFKGAPPLTMDEPLLRLEGA